MPEHDLAVEARPGVLSDVEVAVRAAQAAADVLLALRSEAAGAPDLRARGDREAQQAIAQVLGQLRPGDAVLSEEAVDDSDRLSADRVWIVDPLDGTREYGEAGREDWAVHVALWERRQGAQGDLTRAAVALPARGAVLTTDDVSGGLSLPAPHAGPPRFAVSRTRATRLVQDVAAALGAELVPMGSAGYKVAAVVLGQVDAYVHTGGQYEWDSAAPVAVARAAGLHTSRVDGSPLRYNQPDVSLPDLVVCRRELADDVLALIAQLSTDGNAVTGPGTDYRLSHLRTLEAEAIHIFREVVAELERPVLLFSGGKDSIVMLRLAEKAFYPGRIPFPVLHVDTGLNFPEVLAFRDARVDELGVQLLVASVQEAIDAGTVQQEPNGSRNRIQTPVLLDAVEKHRFAALFGGARRDEEKARAKERVYSFRDEFGQWDPKNQRPELWSLYNGRIHLGESIRIFPLSNWTELDVWQYIGEEGIALPPLYFAREREVFESDGMLYEVNEFTSPQKGEPVSVAMTRYRTVGDANLTAAVRSDADTLDKIIDEVAATRVTERGATRGDDKVSEAAMEDRKREGYF